jgi:hypothetical protein
MKFFTITIYSTIIFLFGVFFLFMNLSHNYKEDIHTNIHGKEDIDANINNITNKDIIHDINSADDLNPFKVRLRINVGGVDSVDLHDIIIIVNPLWAPFGAKQFKQLVRSKFYDECRFFRGNTTIYPTFPPCLLLLNFIYIYFQYHNFFYYI